MRLRGCLKIKLCPLSSKCSEKSEDEDEKVMAEFSNFADQS
jgi:hypothetical protein